MFVVLITLNNVEGSMRLKIGGSGVNNTQDNAIVKVLAKAENVLFMPLKYMLWLVRVLCS